MSTKKFNFKQMSMGEEMRENILDEVRKVVDSNSNSVEQTTLLKLSLQKLFQGEWQVIIGEGELATYFSRKYIENFIELKYENKTMLIFKRISTEHPIPSKK